MVRAVADRQVRCNLEPTLANLLGDLPHAVHLLLVTDLMGFLGSLPSACLLPATILATWSPVRSVVASMKK
jgi:hypothetical protein